MADERDETEHTEDPTPRRLEEAIKRGDVVKSAEVATWFTIAGGTLIMMVFAAPMAGNLEIDIPGAARPFRPDSDRRAGARGAGAERWRCVCSPRSAFRFCCWRSRR